MNQIEAKSIAQIEQDGRFVQVGERGHVLGEIKRLRIHILQLVNIHFFLQ